MEMELRKATRDSINYPKNMFKANNIQRGWGKGKSCNIIMSERLNYGR